MRTSRGTNGKGAYSEHLEDIKNKNIHEKSWSFQLKKGSRPRRTYRPVPNANRATVCDFKILACAGGWLVNEKR